MNNILNQVNYILKVEGEDQLAGIEKTLGIKSHKSLVDSEKSYRSAREHYREMASDEVDVNNIESAIAEAVTLLAETKQAVDDTIIVLDNTVSYAGFTEASLMAQQTAFTTLRTTVISAQTSAQATYQILQNLDLNYQSDVDALQNAVTAAKNQVVLAQTGYDNAVVILNSAKQGKEQQLVGAQTSMDSAQGQLNLVQSQASDLNIKASITGQVTQKYVELGAEVSPGQKIAQISQAEMVKIEISLPSDDIYRVEQGQSVTINGELEATISRIDPAADPVTRKVKVEISYDNKNKDLIPETFVDISIPTKKRTLVKEGHFYVPLKAVTIAQNEKYVFIMEDSLAKKVVVEIGETQGELIEIISGLNDGDELVVEGAKNLEDGDEVVIE